MSAVAIWLAPGAPTPVSDYEVGTCPECVTLDPARPGLAVRAALRYLGKPEDPLAAAAFAEAGVDVTAILYDRGDPLGSRGSRGPQRKPFGHIDAEGKAALRVGYAALLRARVEAAAESSEPRPPEARWPQGCLACGASRSLNWHGPLPVERMGAGPEMTVGGLRRLQPRP
ncbi:MAG: hypothetical protein L0H25_10120 [Micrococcales bacterium]|nr:hypothetical protein [Micrococcales bacterium]